MKREGRQHGMVRNYKANFNSKSSVNRFDTPPTAGLFTKVSSKPTNHSKFTGKCGKSKCFECHSHPSCKSKDKGKGSYKIRSTDVSTNHRLISWRVVDNKGNRGLNYVGLSSNEVLEDHHGYDVNIHHIHDDIDGSFGLGDGLVMGSCHLVDDLIINVSNDMDHDVAIIDDDMGFCNVGFVVEQVDGDGDEGWCLVEEM
ncbi:Histone-lysine n-methyltransferase trithorax-like protein [Thalictrum thalictroides]|uniref:Histone-lysine n-methyltransferase trithorax-like protein n=1 Tax=Thalictrum thalictroides TaxID=46969 RepID=A0A7J6WS20_THATH|nr:Histone-lysine n-methyltransferase trithorax-like protein [Thalictrum thalictroides]